MRDFHGHLQNIAPALLFKYYFNTICKKKYESLKESSAWVLNLLESLNVYEKEIGNEVIKRNEQFDALLKIELM